MLLQLYIRGDHVIFINVLFVCYTVCEADCLLLSLLLHARLSQYWNFLPPCNKLKNIYIQ